VQLYRYRNGEGTNSTADTGNAESNAGKDRRNQERMEAKLGANQSKAAKQEEMLAEISTRMDANTKEMNATQERMNANLKDLKEDIKSSQVEMRSTICAFRSELKETIQHEMKAVIQPIRSELDGMTACNRVTETEPNPGMMQSIEEHQEILKKDAAVMPVGGLRKWRRVCNLAAKHCQKMKERTQGYCESRRKLAAACGKVSHCAKVAWQKRNIRKMWTLEKCGR
jgi:hypothetical protein